jgi:hypothetical protein
MELVELLKKVVAELSPFVECGIRGQEIHDPGRDIEGVVDAVCKVLDKGLPIGRGC